MRALVTGGAGLIGSHLADLLRSEGYAVRIFDALEPRTHPGGVPPWVRPGEFVRGDVRDEAALREALRDVDLVFHQAAYGGFFPETAKLCDVNVTGTGRLLDVIRDGALPVRKIVVASSQVVYREGSARCPEHGIVQPAVRDVSRLRAGDFAVRCPVCGEVATSVPTSETAPAGGDTAYAVTKYAQERLALAWSAQTGIPVVALRYACTYGPRQSLHNPYTGLIAIFCTRLLAGKAPVLYEDGEQTRDLCFVEDVARANLAVATTDALDGLAVNVGTGAPVSVRRVASAVASALGIPIEAEASGEFRPGDIRHLTPDLTLLERTGFRARVGLEDGIARYVTWLRQQGDVRDLFSGAREHLRAAGLVQRFTRERA